MATTQSSWAQLRQQARAQETQVGILRQMNTGTVALTLQQQTETLFHSYSQYASKTDIEPKPSEEEQRLEEQLNDMLEKVYIILINLYAFCESQN